MISTSDLKKGRKILYDNTPYMVIDFMHVKPGKGGAYVRTKMKNMITGLMHEVTFHSGEKFEDPGLEYKDMQYLYNDESLFHFMDLDSFEQVSLNKNQIEEAFDYLKEQEIYNALYFKGKLIAISAPMFMELKVTDAPPGVKGNTAQGGATKTITLETGLKIQAPLFIEEGEILKVDTRTNEYIERIK